MKIRKSLGTLFLSMLLVVCFAITALAGDQTKDKAAERLGGIVQPPKIDMQYIRVYPTYYDESGTLKTASGYRYSRTGNFSQTIAINVTLEQQNAMKQNVANTGFQQVGYEIIVDYVMPGNYTSGRVVSKIPDDIPVQFISPGRPTSTTFYTTLENPGLYWYAGVRYFYKNNECSQMMTAAASFLKE